MPNYLYPGVYVEENDSGARPIEAVGTSTAGFVGVAPESDVYIGQAIALNNWTEFLKKFTKPEAKYDKPNHLANAVQGFFLNGGSRCYVAPVPKGGPLAGKNAGFDALNRIDEVAIIAAPGMTDQVSYNAVIQSAVDTRDRVAILDAIASTEDLQTLTQAATLPDDKGKQAGGVRPPENDKGMAACYFPWIRAVDALTPVTGGPDDQRPNIVSVPPSGHMAGIFARTDTERGVHKAPANQIVRGALGLTQLLTDSDQGQLNQAGVNCIRFFTREGIRVWGARTIAASSSNWRYLNVRRLFTMVEESIAINTRWVVFEPNDKPLWTAIKRDVGAFLTQLWRQGALVGTRPEEAFFVKCDAETNPPDEVDAGRVTIVIGLAPVKPAEFVIFRIGQTQSGTSVQ
jgi:phage tail sheath protein FI